MRHDADTAQFTIDQWIDTSSEGDIASSTSKISSAENLALRRNTFNGLDQCISNTEKLKFCEICKEITKWILVSVRVKGNNKRMWRCECCILEKRRWRRRLYKLVPHIHIPTQITGICEDCHNYKELKLRNGEFVCESCGGVPQCE